MKNLARLLAITTRPELKAIRVRGEVLTCTNGNMMVRRYAPNVADGDYTVDQSGQLARIGTIHWYPDVEQMETHVKNAATLCDVEPRIRGHLASTSHDARQLRRPVTLDTTGAWVDNEVEERVGGFHFQFNLSHPVRFPADQFVIAMNELARYENVKFLKTADERSPLVMGLNWGSCVLIMPIAYHHSRMQDDMQRRAFN